MSENVLPEPAWNSLIDLRDRAPLHDSHLDSPGEAPDPAPKQPGSRTWPTAVRNLTRRVPRAWWPIAGVCLLCLVIAWTAGVIKVNTPDGVIVLEGVPVDAVVEIDGQKITVAPKQGKPVRVEKPPGKYFVEVTHGEDRILGESVTLNSGKECKADCADRAPISDRAGRGHETERGGAIPETRLGSVPRR